MKKRILLVSLVLAGTFSSAFAGNGKITGKATDSDTKEPLIGANVVIVGTSYGAVTNVEGRYTILSVPPGDYDLRATYVGYQEQTITGLRVNADDCRRIYFCGRIGSHTASISDFGVSLTFFPGLVRTIELRCLEEVV